MGQRRLINSRTRQTTSLAASPISGGKFGWCEKTEVTPLRWSPEALRPAGAARSNSARGTSIRVLCTRGSVALCHSASCGGWRDLSAGYFTFSQATPMCCYRRSALCRTGRKQPSPTALALAPGQPATSGKEPPQERTWASSSRRRPRCAWCTPGRGPADCGGAVQERMRLDTHEKGPLSRARP
jgi:hypothetical protein